MENEGHIANFRLYRRKRFKRKPGPVCGVLAVNIAYACRKHGYAEVSNGFTFVGVCALTLAYNAVLFAAYGADFGFKAQTELLANVHEFGSLRHIFIYREMRAVEHDGGEAGFYALIAALVCTVVKVKCDGHRDVEFIYHSLDHCGYNFEARHILACTFGNA